MNSCCDSNCKIESGYYWEVASSNVYSTWATKCGDGVVAGSEKLDDKNFNNGDGCSSNCITDTTETGMKEDRRVIVITDREHTTHIMETSIQANRIIVWKGKEKLTTRTERSSLWIESKVEVFISKLYIWSNTSFALLIVSSTYLIESIADSIALSQSLFSRSGISYPLSISPFKSEITLSI